MSLKLTLFLFNKLTQFSSKKTFFCQNLPPDFYCSTNLPPVNDRATAMFPGLCSYDSLDVLFINLLTHANESKFQFFFRNDRIEELVGRVKTVDLHLES